MIKSRAKRHNIESNARRVWNSLRQRAKRRGIKVALTYQEFVEWYENETKNCHYCKIPENEFIGIWGEFYGGRRGHRLEIDRKNPEDIYTVNTIVLACCLCNCAKSNMFKYEEFKNVGEVIEKIWRQRKNKKVQ